MNGASWRGGETWLWAMAGLITRVPFASRLPYHWDGVQFVMGLTHYDVRLHQPHPPGYLLYVVMGRLLLPLAGDGHRALVWISLLCSGLGAAVCFQLADEALGRRPARTAAALFLTGPLFWFFGEIALTYAADFALVGLVALHALRLYRGDGRWTTVLRIGGALGVAGGVRATTLVFLAPLCLLAVGSALRRRAAARGGYPRPVEAAPDPTIERVPGMGQLIFRLVASAALGAVVTVGWLIPTAAASGGWSGYRSALAVQREFVNETAVWTVGWGALVGGLATHAGCLVNALGAAVLPLVVSLALRIRDPKRSEALPHGLGPFALTWAIPSALFYALVHFGSPGYAMTYLGAILLATAWALEMLWRRMSGRVAATALAAIAVLNVAAFLGASPAHRGETGFGVVTAHELQDHERYWQSTREYVRAHYRPGEVAVLVVPSFTDGLRMAQCLLPEYWPDTGLVVDPKMLRTMRPSLLPRYFRYLTPEKARQDPRPTLCLARGDAQRRYYRTLFGDAYQEREIGHGVRIGFLQPGAGALAKQVAPKPQ